MSALKDLQNVSFEEKKNTTKFHVPPTPQTSRLGYGTGVGVYAMSRESNSQNLSPWALKKVERKFKGQKIFSERLKVEAKILKSLSHPNIIGFRGEGKTKDGRVCLAMETCGKSLGDVIEERRNQELGPFPVKDIFKVAEGICSALNYLHQEKSLMHGDVKSFNVLVKDNFEHVKLCDFGTPIALNRDGVMVDDSQEYVGTELWSAPEVLIEDVVSDKADVFSFGLTLWEMLALEPPNLPAPAPDSLDSSCWSQDSDASIVEVTSSGNPVSAALQQSISAGNKPKIPSNLGPEYKPIVEIIDLCTIEDYTERPSAATVLKIIQSMREKQ